MTKEQFLVLVKRFIRGFLSGGIGSVAAMLMAGVTVHSLIDLQQFAFAIAVAFISGGLLSIDKLLRME